MLLPDWPLVLCRFTVAEVHLRSFEFQGQRDIAREVLAAETIW